MIGRGAFILVACLVAGAVQASAWQATTELNMADAQLRNLTVGEDGYLRNVGSDGYLIFGGLEIGRDQACGITLDIEFKSMMPRPGIFEIFWRGAGQTFIEQRKAFVIINQDDTQTRQQFMIPLCKLYHFSGNLNLPERQSFIEGVRIDYPANKNIALRVHSISLIDAEAMTEQLQKPGQGQVILEPYERINAASFASFDVALPKLYFAFEEGLHRLARDKSFVVAWLALIAGLFALMLRSVLRRERL